MAQREITKPLSIPEGTQWRLALVRSEFNSELTSLQLASAQECCERYGVAYDVYTVAGAYEIPWMAAHALRSKRYNGVVALGCLIKGETPHFEIIAESVGRVLAQMQIQDGSVPVGFGVITALNPAQAQARTVIGEDATRAVLQSLIQAHGS